MQPLFHPSTNGGDLSDIITISNPQRYAPLTNSRKASRISTTIVLKDASREEKRHLIAEFGMVITRIT